MDQNELRQTPESEEPKEVNEERQAEPKKEKPQKRIPLFAAIVLALILAVIVFVSTFTVMQNRLEASVAEKETELARFSKLDALLAFVEKQYVRGIDESELFENVYAAVLNATKDPYSCYMTEEEYAEYTGERQGSYVGIGINVVYDPEAVGMLVYRVMPGSPAEKAGIQKGDLIVGVGEIDITPETYNDAVAAVKGAEGTEVFVRVKRGEEELTLTATRGVCETVEVFYENLDGIAYIQITSFRSTVVTKQFTKALEQAKKDGCKAYLFDVRNNPGGDLGVICDVLDTMIADKVLVHMVDADGNDTTRSTKTEAFLDAPMAVLCNGNSASAAELFTADLRENRNAYIVGETTYGKGTMQTVRKLTDGSAVKLTNRYYNPTSNVSYDGIGIVPDLTVGLPGGPNASFYLLSQEEDSQLQAALDYLRK